MGTVDLNWLQMAAIYSLALVPLFLIWRLRLGLLTQTLVAGVRMSVQLLLVGLYLNVLFEWENVWLNAAWMIVMITVANFSILKQSGLRRRRFMPITLAGTTVVSVGVTMFFVAVIIRPDPILGARYLIPIFGMVLGNCIRGNVLSLERFYHGIRQREKEYVTRLMLGANPSEATEPFMVESLRAALGPHLAVMATMGIVSLPGMMTGQILGGSAPLIAIKYQIAIMICIFTVMLAGSALNIYLSRKVAFDPCGTLRQDIFVE